MLIREQPNKKFVLDRYFYSTIAYHEAKSEGATRGLKSVYRNFKKPDLVILVKSDFKTIKSRITARNENALNDQLFLTNKLVCNIYRNYLNVIDTKFIVVNNNSDLSSVYKQIDNILK